MRSKNPFNIAEPFNIAASVHELADSDHAACQLAVRDALQSAGVVKGDAVVVAGYSQGGLVAAELAAGGQNNVVGVITVGAPVGHVAIPESIPVMSIEHANDVVPALAGKINPLTENWVTVGREVEVKAGQTALVAHELTSYQKTAGMIDESASAGVARIRDELLAKFEGLRLVETQTFNYEGGR
jgi:pimeloyl-ACP methyl ester carboxylesterase